MRRIAKAALVALATAAAFASCAGEPKKSSDDDDDSEGVTIGAGGNTSTSGSSGPAGPGAGGSVGCIAPEDCAFLDDECNDGVCAGGTCDTEPRAAGTPCGDPSEDACDLGDSCDGLGSCTANNQPDGTPCSEDPCTEGEQCVSGQCSGGTPKDCSSLTVGCNKGICNTSTGTCTTTAVTTCTSGDGCCPSSCTATNDAECATAGGTVRQVNGTLLNVEYVLCGSGTPGTCTASAAKSACAAIGRKVVSHASNGTSQVLSLGATSSCYYSISYYTVNVSMPPGSCLVGVSNLDWTSCCGTSQWHGNTVPFGPPNQTFGYVYSSDSGYVSTNPNVSGGTWGCDTLTAPAGNASGCSAQYVACAL